MISVVLPTYNEMGSILQLTAAIHTELKEYDHEILVVDDDSPDGTYQAVVDSDQPNVRGILRTENKGFANSIRCGIENAKGDIIIIMDSDFNHQPKYLKMMVHNTKFYDCVTASRFVFGGSMDKRSRHLMSWFFNIFVRIMTGGKVTDSLYGYLAIRKESLDKINFDEVFWGYGDYCIRLLYYLQKNNAEILQFPAVNGKRIAGEANSGFIKVFMQYTREVIKLTFKTRF